jgi:hypothetical protein
MMSDVLLGSSAPCADAWQEAKGEPLHVRLHYLVQLIIGTIESQTGRKSESERDGTLCERVVGSWMKKVFGSGRT